MTNATDRLRALLDERGVEYYKHEDGEPLRELHEGRDDATSWRVGGANVCAVPFDDYTFDLWIDHATPEQAIDATLGRGTCQVECFDDGMDEGMDGEWFAYATATWHLSCGHEVYGSERPRYCSVCGKRVVEP